MQRFNYIIELIFLFFSIKSQGEARLKEAYDKISKERAVLEERVKKGQNALQMVHERLLNEKAELEQQLTIKLKALEQGQKIERENFEKTLTANQVRQD